MQVLLAASRVRAVGRRRRQRELARSRIGRSAFGTGALGSIILLLVALMMSGAAAYAVMGVVQVGQEVTAERQGRLPVDAWFIARVSDAEAHEKFLGIWPVDVDTQLHDAFDREAARRAGTDLDRRELVRLQLCDAVLLSGAASFVAREDAVPGLAGAAGLTGPGATLGSLALLVWLVSLVLAGEGLEVDVGRRRHPLWEWLFSHPVRPSAVFAAEMLAPIVGNPLYWTVPLVPQVLYAQAYGVGYGVLAALLIGVPLAIAAAAMGRAIEVAVMLRLAVRSRGAAVGLMSGFGMAGLAILAVTAVKVDAVGRAVLPLLDRLPLPARGLPWLGWFLGDWNGRPSPFLGMCTCLAISIAITGMALASTAWSTARGLAGKVGRGDTKPGRQARFRGRHALFRKELAWFVRDRSALVEVLSAPAGLVVAQFFYWHDTLAALGSGWHVLCGGAILFGTYFFSVVGPKSLTSEGGTLWLAMTWPHGVDALLRSKAWFWTFLASVPALGAMIYAAFMFPGESWKVLLVAGGWCVFAPSMAVKAVTLARVTKESGETEEISAGQRWAVQLGVASFTTGVLTQQIGPAVSGIVFSIVTAGAMWQNLRARLPFLLDPWSERAPPAPTLMHAMVAVSLLVDLAAVLAGIAGDALGEDAAQAAIAVVYGPAAVAVSAGVVLFLRRRKVPLRVVWNWGADKDGVASWQRPIKSWAAGLLAGIGAGLLLGAFGVAYITLLEQWPVLAEALQRARETTSAIPGAWASILVTAVLFAPLAEEFLFRGLLFRSMARDWPGWQAVLVSAAFFASYHPMLSWLPVGLLGVACALLFRRTRQLADSVALHATYNAVVIGWQWLG